MKLHIHMKSGKTITVKGVMNYEVNFTSDNKVTGLRIVLYPWVRWTILMGALSLDQIEAITKTHLFFW